MNCQSITFYAVLTRDKTGRYFPFRFIKIIKDMYGLWVR
jgi:hypothetical protein